MHLFVIYKEYADIRRGSIGGGGVKYNKANGLRSFSEALLNYGKHVPVSCGLLVLATQPAWVLAAFIINIRSFSINALNAICLNSFRFKSA